MNPYELVGFKDGSKKVVKTIGIPVLVIQLLYVSAVYFFSEPVYSSNYFVIRTMEWQHLPLYFVVPGLILFLFDLIFVLQAIRIKRLGVSKYFALSILSVSLSYFWSAYVQSSSKAFVPDKLDYLDYHLHDYFWFLFFALFIFFTFLHLEYQRNLRVTILKSFIIIIGVAPAIFLTIVYSISGVDYFQDPVIAPFIQFTIYFAGGLFVSIYAAYSYYNCLNLRLNSRDFTRSARFQFTLVLGLVEALILMTTYTLFRFPKVFFGSEVIPLFFIPLLILYLRDPNFLTTLVSPVYELFIIKNGGVPVYQFQLTKTSTSNKLLKGGFVSAIFMYFNSLNGLNNEEIVVRMDMRAVIIKKIQVGDEIWLFAVVAERLSKFLDIILNQLSKDVYQFLKVYENRTLLEKTSMLEPPGLRELILRELG